MRDIRHEIDRLDQQIISLLGRRLRYVQEAAKFKTSASAVRGLDRVASMLTDRERWATEQGLQPEPIRQLYTHLIEYFTEHELREWARPSQPTDGSETGGTTAQKPATQPDQRATPLVEPQPPDPRS